MKTEWSPHPRYRLYTGMASYRIPARHLLKGERDAEEAAVNLEAEVCRRFAAPAAACVPKARTGLCLGLQTLIKPGQTVVMSPLTIIDVVNMVLLAGGVPLFADISRNSCSMDPEAAERLIDTRTGAVLITHLHGEAAEVLTLRDICRRRGVPLIEDAAQAFGAVENGRRLGTIGDLGVYSFGFYKNLSAWCGGMVVAQNPALIAGIRRRMEGFRALPRRRLLALALGGLLTDVATWPPLFGSLTHPVIRCGIRHRIAAVDRMLDPESNAIRLEAMPADYLFRMTASQLALAAARFDLVDEDSRVRMSHAEKYYQGLAGITSLSRPQWRSDGSNIYTYYPIRCRDREALLRHAILQRRDFAAQCLRNCADLPEFREFYRSCPNARRAAGELVLLPTYPRYPAAEIELNIEEIRGFYASRPACGPDYSQTG